MLQELELRDFRCFPAHRLALGQGWNFFIGPNAVGKTSLLEAICVLLRLQSPRSSTLSRCVRFGTLGFALRGQLGAQQLEVSWVAGSRKLRLDGVPQSRSDFYLTCGRITWFGNEDIELVRGGGAGRRRYLDFFGLQSVPGYAAALRAYQRALRSRNFLLREGRPRREIAAYDEPLVQHGTALWRGRAQFYRALEAAILQAAGEISAKAEAWSMDWKPQPEAAGEDFAQQLQASQMEEERLRQTVVGPHRDDFALLLHGEPAADFASEGQQRSLALALKLAQARLLGSLGEKPPILLLDDIFGELDPWRRNRLLQSLPGESQKVVTTTHLDWAELPAEASVFSLPGGNQTESSGGRTLAE